MLFRVTVAVYCENHTEHTAIVRTSQETNRFRQYLLLRVSLQTNAILAHAGRLQERGGGGGLRGHELEEIAQWGIS
jgi:hypothetical protein